MSQKGAVSLIVPLLLIIIVAAFFYFFFSFNQANLPFQKNNQDKTTTTEPVKVNLQQNYQNPFDKNTQYVNPFSEYKNPFDSLK